jgi:hypothetical protein
MPSPCLFFMMVFLLRLLMTFPTLLQVSGTVQAPAQPEPSPLTPQAVETTPENAEGGVRGTVR